jgi:hypothetical protein
MQQDGIRQTDRGMKPVIYRASSEAGPIKSRSIRTVSGVGSPPPEFALRFLTRGRRRPLVSRDLIGSDGAFAVKEETAALVERSEARSRRHAVESQARSTRCRGSFTGPIQERERYTSTGVRTTDGQAMNVERLVRKCVGPEHRILSGEARDAYDAAAFRAENVVSRLDLGAKCGCGQLRGFPERLRPFT